MRGAWWGALGAGALALLGCGESGSDSSPAGGGAGTGSTGPGGADASSCYPGGAGVAAPTTGVVAVAGGEDHTCVILEGGRVRCWGMGLHGRLGYGNTDDIGDDELPASAGDVQLGGNAVQLTCGSSHTCALLDDGTVKCWGYGNFGQLGYGSDEDVGDDEVPADLPVLDFGIPVVQIDAGGYFTCALLEDGSVRCWGDNRYGELGTGTTRPIGDESPATDAAPVDVGGTVTQISGGSRVACAVLVGGAVRCWGNGTVGAMGHGDTENIGDDELPSSAGDVELGAPARQVEVGRGHVCAILECGEVRCWGLERYGSLGIMATENVGDDELPTAVDFVDVGGAAREITAGLEIDQHTCVLLTDGAVRCWGWGATGVLGYGNQAIIGDDEVPASVGPVDIGAGPIVTTTAGGAHHCVLIADGNTGSVNEDETPATVGAVPVP